MAATATQTYLPEIAPRSARDWEFVKSLLQDLEAEEHREELASLFGQWKLSIKAFRRVEGTQNDKAITGSIRLEVPQGVSM